MLSVNQVWPLQSAHRTITKGVLVMKTYLSELFLLPFTAYYAAVVLVGVFIAIVQSERVAKLFRKKTKTGKNYHTKRILHWFSNKPHIDTKSHEHTFLN